MIGPSVPRGALGVFRLSADYSAESADFLPVASNR